MAIDLAILSLYDITLLLDDSGSMATMEDGSSRFSVLTEVCKIISFFSVLMDDDGISCRFLNAKIGTEGDNLKSFENIQRLMSNVYPDGTTPIGKTIQTKIFDNMISENLTSRNLKKPMLLITITDGIPDSKSGVVSTIKNCKAKCKASIYGENAIAFSFVQIGTDKSATKYLDELDCHREIGNIIDCTSCYEIESQQCLSKYNVELTPGSYLIKLLLGPIDPNYDMIDEVKINIPDVKSSSIFPLKLSSIRSIFSF